MGDNLALGIIEITTPPKYYEPVGRCIYCRRKGVALQREHIIPFGLAANSLVLMKSSCTRCGHKTRDFETRCLRHMWWPFRTKLGRRAIAQAVDEHGRVDFKPEDVVDMSTADFPLFYYAFEFQVPAIVDNRSSHLDGHRGFLLWDEEACKQYLPRDRGIRLGPGDWVAFSKLLAKIAHAYAVAELGIGSFTPALTWAIRDKMDIRLPYWVGGVSEPAPATTALHEIELRRRVIAGRHYASAVMRLFASLGTPRYEVIVGELEPRFDQFALLEKPLYRIDVESPLPV